MHQKDQKVIYMQSSVAAAAWLVIVRKETTHLLLVEQKGFHVTINEWNKIS